MTLDGAGLFPFCRQDSRGSRQCFSFLFHWTEVSKAFPPRKFVCWFTRGPWHPFWACLDADDREEKGHPSGDMCAGITEHAGYRSSGRRGRLGAYFCDFWSLITPFPSHMCPQPASRRLHRPPPHKKHLPCSVTFTSISQKCAPWNPSSTGC